MPIMLAPLMMALPGGFGLIIELLFFCCVAALLWWGFTRLSIPEPIKTIVMVVVGLVLLFMLWSMFSGGFPH